MKTIGRTALALVLAICLSGCAAIQQGGLRADDSIRSVVNRADWCHLFIATGSAATMELAAVVLTTKVFGCNGDCEARKLKAGENWWQAVHHHVRTENDIIVYSAFGIVPLGVVTGWAIADRVCK